MQQLPLGVRLADRAVFDSFLPGPNVAALAAARALAAATAPALLFLHGGPGSGRSHLLQALCAAVPGAGYFPLGELRPLGPAVLEGAEALPLVALDDLQAVAGLPGWDRALFGLYNALQAASGRLAAASALPSGDLPLGLPDLRSRLAAMPHFALRPLDETQTGEALRLRASLRGLDLPEETLQYLQRHFARDLRSQYALLDRLDQASLQQQRRLTVPFIRGVLEGSEKA